MKPITHKYKETNVGKYKQVRHFELVYCDGKNVLTERINISKDRQFANSSPTYWLKNHDGKKWTNSITGLFKVPNQKGVFFGDLRYKQDLIVVRELMTENGTEIVAYVYLNYYPYNRNLNPTQIGLEISNKMNKKKQSIRG